MSLVWHLVLLSAVLWQMAPQYRFPPPNATPAPTAPTMDAEIVTMARLEPPKILPPTPKPAPPPTPKPVPPQPQPQSAPATAPPQPKTPEPAKPTPPKPSPLPAPAPALPAPAPRPAPAHQAAVAKAVATPAVKPAPVAAPSRPSPLNIHKAAQAPPANVPTLPMAPAAGATSKAGGSTPPSGAVTGAASASRLKGLNPYPYGTMPSGGPGLRGTLVGCANADAVNLSPAERARCSERFGEDMSHAPALDPISRSKRAQFDKAVDHEEAERRYRAAEPHALGAPFDAGGTIPHGPPTAGPGGQDQGQYPPK